MKTEKWDGCIAVTALVEDGMSAIGCKNREEADKLAKQAVEKQGVEIAIYQLVGVWKPKTMPVEFVAAEREEEHSVPRPASRSSVPAQEL